jgi:hypothetical protein
LAGEVEGAGGAVDAQDPCIVGPVDVGGEGGAVLECAVELAELVPGQVVAAGGGPVGDRASGDVAGTVVVVVAAEPGDVGDGVGFDGVGAGLAATR